MDFVLSPIPFDLWPRTARLTVRTKHRPGAFRRVTEFLKQSNVTILVSEGSRSAHRYDTWTMIVALERRVIKNASSPNSDIGKYSVNQKGYGGAAKKFQNLEKKLHESLSGEGLLHEEPEDVKLAVPVQIEPHNAM